jgi:hypothetical protein
MNTKEKIQTNDYDKLKYYRKIYKKRLNGKINKNKLIKYKNKIKYIPNEIINNLEFFIKLDEEFKENANKPHFLDPNFKMFSIKQIKNKNWRGIWLRATGMDAKLYLNWLFAPMKYDKYQKRNLKYWYCKEHPNEKYIPNSIKKANEMLNKYIK